MTFEDLVNQFVDTMNGTCNGAYQFSIEVEGEDMDIDQAIAHFQFNEEEFWYAVDDRIFNCSTCGWWSEISECEQSQYGEQVCTQCYEDELNG